MAEDDDSDIDGTEDGELMRFLEQTTFSLQECTASKEMISQCLIDGLAAPTHTERLRSSLMALISIFLRPIVNDYGRTTRVGERGQ